MRRGMESKLIMDSKGAIFAFATGSDFCAEHEGGSREMQQFLCKGANENSMDATVEQLRKHNAQNILIKAVTGNKEFTYPSLYKNKLINRNLDYIHFVEGATKEQEPIYAIVFMARRKEALPLSAYRELDSFYKSDVTGAWDEGSFGIAVKGEKLGKKLKAFYEKLVSGDGVFCGTFFKTGDFEKANGVMIALQSGMRPEHKTPIQEAQTEYEQTVRLKALSRVEEFRTLKESSGDRVRHPGYIWPVWRNGPDSEVVYAVNPDYGSQKLIPYYGPYTFESLKDWMLAEKKYALTPVERNLAAA